jgi:type II secretory pathway pseudopilin PulG
MLAIALIGIIAVGLLLGFGGASRTMSIADERATAESLARSQMESIKNQPYIDYSESSHAVYAPIITPAKYNIDFSVVPFNPDTGEDYDESGGVFDHDDGIQRITIFVTHDVFTRSDKPLTLQGYKLHR